MSTIYLEPLLGHCATTQASEALYKDNQRHARAMPMQRLLGGGMDYADALALHDLGQRDISWLDAACVLGERHLANAGRAQAEGLTATAMAEYRFASACLRFGHSAIFSDTRQKREVYGRMVAAFAEAARLDPLPMQKCTFAYRHGALCAWLVQPQATGNWPLVICLGGFDGWREEYFTGAQYLAQRGIATLLLDGPGQGETRLVHELYLDDDYTAAIACVIDQLQAQQRFTSFSVWGNSMGGYLAAACAIDDSRIQACCVNGGTTHPAEILERFPRFIGKVQAILGLSDAHAAARKLRQFSILGREQALSCPLLQLHGAPDQIFLLENARRIHDGASSTDKRLVVWQDGDHCIYNHTHEKYCELADWFAVRLTDVSQRRQ
ncbi:alpha/beta hydrolase family protein [Pseudomonas japonica]|uniref:alpha/beta hydrolase family protein n=1 Tax=Pseudomonas japonica TaxID=256466 RepID=UPI00381FCC00